MKKNKQKTELETLLRLVNRWHLAKGRVRQFLRAKVAVENDRFHARWHRDGIATLFLQSASRLP